MKIGDLVKPIDPHIPGRPSRAYQTTLVEHDWKGIIIGWEDADPVVFWNSAFPAEIEYKDQVEVISESG